MYLGMVGAGEQQDYRLEETTKADCQAEEQACSGSRC